MDEYLLDVEKSQMICVRELHNNCGCYECTLLRKEQAREPVLNKIRKVLNWFIKWVK